MTGGQCHSFGEHMVIMLSIRTTRSCTVQETKRYFFRSIAVPAQQRREAGEHLSKRVSVTVRERQAETSCYGVCRDALTPA